MQDGDSSNPMQVAEDEPNGECGDGEEQALLFLDSLDGYLTLLDSLSSTLRQGWLELACARHSMGSSRVSSTLLDLKAQSAATTVLLSERVEGSSAGIEFMLRNHRKCVLHSVIASRTFHMVKH
ncbi:hypothetical protein KSP39_PZI009804 [Platanthera zijinensis]|uniref:Vacuolar ATPase assembly protein VMA22 n=1 Tax=Platanthera zijinensis TaxID=2320716 RepID=A0AAP0BK14_9ASPA